MAIVFVLKLSKYWGFCGEIISYILIPSLPSAMYSKSFAIARSFIALLVSIVPITVGEDRLLILEAVREYLEILSDWEDVDKKYVKELNNLLERL